MPVNTPRPEYSEAYSRWKRCRDCYSGEDAVKAAGIEYLPRLDSHITRPEKYSAYLQRGMFFNGTSRTVNGFSGALFQKSPLVSCPDEIVDHLKDISLSGSSLDTFGIDLAIETLLVGRVGVLVDMATEIRSNPHVSRPYWVKYLAEDIVSWKTDRVEGHEVLKRVVLRESIRIEDSKDRFVMKDDTRYRILSIEDGQYTQTVVKPDPNNKIEFITIEAITPLRRGAPLEFIPFVCIGPSSTNVNVDRPPLLDLVDINLSHYRTMADLEHGRHLTALPTPWVSGLKTEGPLEIGSGSAWILDMGGHAGMLEYTGQGLGALEKAESEKRKMMAALGARLLEPDTNGGVEAAQTVAMRHAGEHATIRTIGQVLERAMSTCLKWHTWWSGLVVVKDPLSAECEVELNKDFFSVKMSAQDVEALLHAYQAGSISFKTFYTKLQEGGWAREGVSSEKEKADIKLDPGFTLPNPGKKAEEDPTEDTLEE